MALAQILLRRGTSAEWATANPVLAAGEFGYDSTAKRAKVGDGQNAWTGLSWVTMSSADVTRLEAAAAALQGATAPTDAVMTTIQANPNSAFAQAQKATIDASSQPRLKPTSPDRSAYGGFLYQTSPTAIIGVGAANRIYLVQGVGAGTLRRSENLGVGTIATSVPANCQASSCQQIYEWNGYVYGIFQDTTDSAFKVYRAPITTGGTALTWSAALLTLTPGATSFGCTITGTSNALIVGEYGDPVIGGTKTAKIWRTTDGTTFAATRTFGSAIRHVHAVAADPYNNGHVYASFGDGVADCYVFSNDHGATWQVITCSAGFQGVQISFSADWIYIAPDATAPRSSLFVMDRATRTIRLGSTDSHRNLHVESPGSYTHGVTTSGSTTLTTGAPDYSPVFVAADKGRRIYGNGIPDGTTISAVNSSGNVTLSQAATATATGVTFTIERAERPRQYAFLGAVDPATGIYYGVTNNDPSTMPPGMALGRLMLFMIPYVGGPVIRLEELGIYGTAVFLDAQRLFYGQVYRELTRLT